LEEGIMSKRLSLLAIIGLLSLTGLFAIRIRGGHPQEAPTQASPEPSPTSQPEATPMTPPSAEPGACANPVTVTVDCVNKLKAVFADSTDLLPVGGNLAFPCGENKLLYTSLPAKCLTENGLVPVNPLPGEAGLPFRVTPQK